MRTLAISVPLAVGLNVTVIVHCAFTATLVPQVLVCENEVAFVPVIETATPVSAAVPVFFSVIACFVASVVPTVVLAKAGSVVLGVRLTTGAAAAPVPIKVTVCGEPAALSATLTFAVSEPLAAGLKVTVIVH